VQEDVFYLSPGELTQLLKLVLSAHKIGRILSDQKQRGAPQVATKRLSALRIAAVERSWASSINTPLEAK